MKNIHLVFCSPIGDTLLKRIGHKLTGTSVQVVTHSKYAHAALVLDLDTGPATYEMIQPVITKTEGEIYNADNCTAYDKVSIPVTDEQFDEIFAALQSWFDRRVGYAIFTGCVAAGLTAVAGATIGNEVDEHWSERFDTMMCSEMDTRVIRIPYPGFVPGVRAGAVHPDLCRDGCYQLLTDINGDPR